MKSRKKQRGQAFIESALIMLIFVPVLVGIADFGQVIYFHASLTERARAAARYGAVHTFTDGSAIKNVAVYNTDHGHHHELSVQLHFRLHVPLHLVQNRNHNRAVRDCELTGARGGRR